MSVTASQQPRTARHMSRSAKAHDTIAERGASPLLMRPRGHVVGHRLGGPAPASLAGHPHGHVVGHGPSDRSPRSLVGHPRGHVVGHGPGDSAPTPLAGRPHGHVVGNGIGSRPRAW